MPIALAASNAEAEARRDATFGLLGILQQEQPDRLDHAGVQLEDCGAGSGEMLSTPGVCIWTSVQAVRDSVVCPWYRVAEREEQAQIAERKLELQKAERVDGWTVRRTECKEGA